MPGCVSSAKFDGQLMKVVNLHHDMLPRCLHHLQRRIQGAQSFHFFFVYPTHLADGLSCLTNSQAISIVSSAYAVAINPRLGGIGDLSS